MEPFDYLRVLRRRWPLVIGAPVVALGVALAITVPSLASTRVAPQPYEATHVLFHPDPTGAAVPLGTVSLLAGKGDIPRAATERLGGDDAPSLVANVNVAADADLRIITVTAVLDDPQRAVQLVDVYAEEILAFFDREQDDEDTLAQMLDGQQQQLQDLDDQLADGDLSSAAELSLRDQRDDALRRIGQLSERLNQARNGGVPSVDLRTLQSGVAVPADPEGFAPPTTPGPRLLLATIMGLLLGVALAFAVDKVDTRIRTRKDAETAFGVPVLAEIPRLPRRARRSRALVTAAKPSSAAAEAYRALRLSAQVMSRWLLHTSVEPGSLGQIVARQIDVDVARPGGQVVFVTSPGPREGKTTTVANLAASFAEVNKTVLVLDCDFRKPQIARLLSVEPGPGLSEYLRMGDRRPALEDLAKPTMVPNVWVIPSGQAIGNPAELLAPDSGLLRDAAQLADVVLVDAGPLLMVSEPATLASQVDTVILVSRVGATTIDAAHRATELLARVQAPVSGVAMVGVTASELGIRAYGYYGDGGPATTNGRATVDAGRRNDVKLTSAPPAPEVVRRR